MPRTEEANADRPAPPENIVWHLAVAYDGTRYHGYQIQSTLPTVQQEIQERLARLFRNTHTQVFASSRTDAGVHALDQHISFAAPPHPDFTPEKLYRVLNEWLPPDIVITDVRRETTEFSARFNACAKSYVYALYTGETLSPFFWNRFWHLPQNLNVERMQEAATELTGEHDFASFGVNPRREVHSTWKTIHRLDIIQNDPRQLYIHVIGDSFLYKMVRCLTGFLVKVGLSAEESPPDTRAVLAARDRGALQADTAPPQGLYLAKVFFHSEDHKTYSPPIPPFSLNLA